ncbi:Uncharacterized protein TPAR_07738 [Tolypocladium paradoxum]|uniref:UBC core domain-containing protein n=1 Tax=Tolypocladium paradoxum TaxID=94208 RepID=A0A2S4KPF3_9HYPO|nr:Uncharacterized protein TPAR_07738 [Tolypocladium paradoxum]
MDGLLVTSTGGSRNGPESPRLPATTTTTIRINPQSLRSNSAIPADTRLLSRFRPTLFSKRETIHESSEEKRAKKGLLGLNTLHDPGDRVLVDIIFIHGLAGGSRKTWTDSSNPSSFWPQSWLPVDPDFHQARFHSYGYDAEWRDRTKGFMDIHDFSQSLLKEMENNKSIWQSNSRIILVGHSMGGCVAKKTYVLARQSPSHEQLAARFHSFFFLATPHRGSNLAKVIRNWMQLTGAPKPYLKDLSANSDALTEANLSFQPYARDLHIWSFFETRPMSDIPEVLVVDKFSAVLGYSNEEVSPMDADHRRICKFKNQDDPNYRKVRNALCRAVDLIRANVGTAPVTASRRRLEAYLNVDDSFRDDASALQDKKLPGSCQWFTDCHTFADWATSAPAPQSRPICWLMGRPGSGKSIISGHVVEHLTRRQEMCSYYFFKQGKAGSAGLVSLLTNLVYQMALQDVAVEQRVLQLQKSSVTWEGRDERTVFRKLFVDGIFQAESTSTHFWIIDGLDECSEFLNLFRFISQLPDGIRVLITSRNTPEIDRGILSLESRVQTHQLSIADTELDMRNVIHAALARLPLTETARLGSTIFSRASGSFLWVDLVLRELQSAFTEEDIEEILNDIPDGLNEIYARILRTIEAQKRRARLAKCILSWVVLAVRPLTVYELRHAVQLDLDQTPQKMEAVLSAVCGQLVTVDSSGRVQMIHETAREFLVRDGLVSTLAICYRNGHSHLAQLCISHLSTTFQHLHGTSLPGSPPVGNLQSYAAAAFAQHLQRSESRDEELFAALLSFLDGKALFWIEFVAEAGVLSVILQTAMDLQSYLAHQTQHNSPAATERLKSWIVDLSRVALTFRRQLQTRPSVIHDLIPPLCPSTSAIAQNFNTGRQMFFGLRDATWGDLLMRFHDDLEVRVVCFGESHFAVGINGKGVFMYDATFFHCITEILRIGGVYQLEFGCEDRYLAAFGSRCVSIWNPKSGAMLHQFSDFEARITAGCLAGSVVLVALKDGTIVSSDLKTNISTSYRWMPDPASDEAISLPNRVPLDVIFSNPSQGLVAVCFFTQDVYIFSVDGPQLKGICVPPMKGIVRAMSFNPDPQKHYLAVSYTHDILAAFDLRTMSLIHLEKGVDAPALAWSADGRYLIVGTESFGHSIGVYELGGDLNPTLNLVYLVQYPHRAISAIAAGRTGLKFVSAHETECQVWEPSIHSIHRQDQRNTKAQEGGLNRISSLFQDPDKTRRLAHKPRGDISAMALSPDGQTVLCGNEYGDVLAFSASDGSELGIVYSHPSLQVINTLALVERPEMDLIIATDYTDHFVIAEADRSTSRWTRAKILHREPIRRDTEQILVSPSKDRFLVHNMVVTEVFELPSGNVINKRRVPQWRATVNTVSNCAANESVFMLFSDDEVHLYSWSDFEPAQGCPLKVVRDGHFDAAFTTGVVQHCNGRLFVEHRIGWQERQTTCWEASQLNCSGDPTTIMPHHSLQPLNGVFKVPILVSGSTLVFVDVYSWVCTLNLDTFARTKEAKRHFFLIREWVTLFATVDGALTPNNDLVIVNKQGIIVVKGWLESFETIDQHGLPPGIELVDGDNLREWFLDIRVLDSNPIYQGQTYRLRFQFPEAYPIEPPEVTFDEKPNRPIPLHPHIYSNGIICLDLLGSQGWSPVQSAESVCMSIQSMLTSNSVKERPHGDAEFVMLNKRRPRDIQFVYHDDTV